MPIGWQELLIILVIVLVLFGAGKLAGVGSALGRSVKEFRTQAGIDDSPADSTDEQAAADARSETPTAASTRRG